MARYNTTIGFAQTTGATTVTSPDIGRLITLTGTPPFTVTLPNPDQFIGTPQTFFNATGGVVTFSTPSGVFQGPGSTGTSTQTFPNTGTITLIPNGTNYIVTSSLNTFVDTLTSNQATFNLVNSTVQTVNAFGAASTISIGANSGTVTINNDTVATSRTSLTLFNTTATTVNAFQAADTIVMGSNSVSAQFEIRSTKPSTSTTSAALVVAGGIATTGDIRCASIIAGGSQLTTVGKAIAMALVFGG